MANWWDRLGLCVGLSLSILVGCSAQRIVEGFEGGTVVLPCAVSIQGDLRWKIAGSNIVILIRPANGSVLPPENSPWKDVVSFAGSSNNLHISSLSHQRDDNFAFWCEGLQGGRGQNTTVRVLVKITGVSIEQAIGGQVTVTEGENITLTCAMTGNPDPPPSYSWRVNGDNVTGQGSTYNLTANRSMRSIRCTAKNTYSNGSVLSTEEATATLNVLYKLACVTNQLYVSVTEISDGLVTAPGGGGAEPNPGAIVGGVLGSLVGILVICAGVVIVLKRHKTKGSPQIIEDRHMASIGENNEGARHFPADADNIRDPNVSQVQNYETLNQFHAVGSSGRTYDQLHVPVIGTNNRYENTEVPGTRTTTSRDNYETLGQTQPRAEGSPVHPYDQLQISMRGKSGTYENTEVAGRSTTKANDLSYENVNM